MTKVITPRQFKDELVRELGNNHPVYVQAVEKLKDWMRDQSVRGDDEHPEFWVFREAIRSRYIYPQVRLEDEAFQRTWNVINSTSRLFVHPAVKDPSLVAFTENPTKGQADIQTVTKIGRFLTKRVMNDICFPQSYQGAMITRENYINAMANAYTQTRKIAASERNEEIASQTGLSILREPEEVIAAYYECAASSCMKHPADRWSLYLDTVHIPKDYPEEVKKRIERWVEIVDKQYSVEEIQAWRHTYETDRKRQGHLYFPSMCTQPNRTMLHPMMAMSLSPELGLAVYKDKNAIVSRATVNVETKKWQKHYGQDFITTVLQREGYTRGSLAPFSFPRIATTTHTHALVAPANVTNDTPAVGPASNPNKQYKLLSPYIDGDHIISRIIHTGENARVQVDNNARGGFLLRNYADGILKYTNRHVCSECSSVFSQSSALTEIGDKSACTACAPALIEKMLDTHVFAWAKKPSVKELCITLVEKSLTELVPDLNVDQYVDDNCVPNKYLLNYIRGSQGSNHSGTLRKLAMTIEGRENWRRATPEAVRLFFKRDVITNNMGIRDKMHRVITPHGGVGYTTAPTMRLVGKRTQTIIQSYNTDRIAALFQPQELDSNGIRLAPQLHENYKKMGLVKLYRSPGSYDRTTYAAMKEDTCQAIATKARTVETMMKHDCVYSYSTLTWYAVSEIDMPIDFGHMRYPLKRTDFNKHDQSILEADVISWTVTPGLGYGGLNIMGTGEGMVNEDMSDPAKEMSMTLIKLWSNEIQFISKNKMHVVRAFVQQNATTKEIESDPKLKQLFGNRPILGNETVTHPPKPVEEEAHLPYQNDRDQFIEIFNSTLPTNNTTASF